MVRVNIDISYIGAAVGCDLEEERTAALSVPENIWQKWVSMSKIAEPNRLGLLGEIGITH